jgi:hypothetical protein
MCFFEQGIDYRDNLGSFIYCIDELSCKLGKKLVVDGALGGCVVIYNLK